MKNAIKSYLRENIDEKVTLKSWDSKEYLPLHLHELYKFYKLNILEESCLLMEVINEVPGIENLKKHMKVIRKSLNDNLVFLFKSISSFRRKSLIKERISFIIEDGQIYLPFLGMDLKKMTLEKTDNIEKFSVTTQLIFLYYLYNKDLIINATELAKMLETSVMTASRVLNDLYSLGLLTYETKGKTARSKYYQRIDDPDYYKIGSRYLKNPVSKIVYVENIETIKKLPVAGLEALSINTMLNPPRRLVRAISKKKVGKIKDYMILNRDMIADMDLIEVEIWEYEPGLLARNNVVDLLSMTLSINFADERVERAIEERLKGEVWYSE